MALRWSMMAPVWVAAAAPVNPQGSALAGANCAMTFLSAATCAAEFVSSVSSWEIAAEPPPAELVGVVGASVTGVASVGSDAVTGLAVLSGRDRGRRVAAPAPSVVGEEHEQPGDDDHEQRPDPEHDLLPAPEEWFLRGLRRQGRRRRRQSGASWRPLRLRSVRRGAAAARPAAVPARPVGSRRVLPRRVLRRRVLRRRVLRRRVLRRRVRWRPVRFRRVHRRSARAVPEPECRSSRRTLRRGATPHRS